MPTRLRPVSDSLTHTLANADARYADSHSYSHADADLHSGRHRPVPHPHRDSNTHAYSHTIANVYLRTDSHTDANPHSHADADGHRNYGGLPRAWVSFNVRYYGAR